MDLEITDKQEALIEKIEDVLGVSFEEWCKNEGRKETKFSASAFIDAYIDEFREECGFGR